MNEAVTTSEQLRQLANAILRGCEVRKEQCFYQVYGMDGNSSCVLGAACDGEFGKGDGAAGQRYDDFLKKYPILFEAIIDPFSTLRTSMTIGNDELGWTREEIAEELRETALMLDMEQKS